VDLANSNESIGSGSLAVVTGIANAAFGTSSGAAVTNAIGNSLFGVYSGCAITTGGCNVAVGISALCNLTTGSKNTAIGCRAGGCFTVESNNTIIGVYDGVAGCCNNVWITTGTGDVRVQVNCQGAFAFSGSGFGTAGQVLQSQGNALPPVWAPATADFATPTTLGTVVGATPVTTGLTGLALGLCAGGTTSQCVINRCSNVSIGFRAGSCQGLTTPGAGFNTLIGACAGALNCGTYNILVGANAGSCFVGSESCNLIIGSNGFAFAGCTNMFLLASPAVETPGVNSGSPFIYGNACGAISFRTDAATSTIDGCYGASGQFLQSRGAANSPTWAALPLATRFVPGIVTGCTSSSNTLLGQSICFSGTPGTGNTLLGSCVGKFAFQGGGCENTIIGSEATSAIYTCICQNTIIGAKAGGFNCNAFTATSGNQNIAIGYYAWPNWGGTVPSPASCNVIIGSFLDPPVATGSCQLAIGQGSINPGLAKYWLTGCPNGNIRPGFGILDCSGSAGSNGQYLSATGANGVQWRNLTVPPATTQTAGTVLGFTTAASTNTNTALGAFALLQGLNDPSLSNGNTIIGSCAALELGVNVGECFNTGVGAFALGGNAISTRFNATTALGYCAGYLSSSTSVSIPCNVYIGFCTGVNRGNGNVGNTIVGALAGNGGSGQNNTLLGFGAQTSLLSSSNQVVLGNGDVTIIRAAVTTITSLSDARDKKDVLPLTTGIDFVKDLKPVTFKWDHRDPEITARRGFPDMGFIAQDLLETEIKHGTKNHTQLVHDANPDQLEASYSRLVPVLVKAIQELSEEVERLKAKVGE
jgi:hypothetical protein